MHEPKWLTQGVEDAFAAGLFCFVGAGMGGMGMGEQASERKRKTRGGGERGRWREGEREDSHLLYHRLWLRATSHTRLSARDHYTSSTLIGGKGGAGSGLLHTMLEGPTEWVCECTMVVKSTWIPMWHRMEHVSWSLGLFSKPPLGGNPNTKTGRPRHSKRSQPLIDSSLSCVRTRMKRNLLK